MSQNFVLKKCFGNVQLARDGKGPPTVAIPIEIKSPSANETKE